MRNWSVKALKQSKEFQETVILIESKITQNITKELKRLSKIPRASTNIWKIQKNPIESKECKKLKEFKRLWKDLKDIKESKLIPKSQKKPEES